MPFLSELKRFFSEPSELSVMARAKAEIRQIPNGATYVTIGPALVLGDVAGFLRQTQSHQSLGFLPEMMHFAAPGYSQHIYYLVLNDADLMLIRDGEAKFSTPISSITNAQAYLGGGFVLSLATGQGLALATQTPVTIPAESTYRTVSGMSNIFSGWDKELSQYGVDCKF